MFLIIVLLNLLSITTIQSNDEQHFLKQCGDFKAQQHIAIDMLLGKWFAVEIIYHDREDTTGTNNEYNDNNQSNVFSYTCPVIGLDEVQKDNKVNKNDDYYNQRNTMDTHEEPLNWDELMEPLLKVWQEQKNHEKYNRRITTTIRPTHAQGHEDYQDFKKQSLQRLRLIWNEDVDGARSEYSLRYNESRCGYWMSFGSQSDAKHNPQFSYTPFIGTIQVLKAVAGHAVLTFCHISKRHDFFTVIISREPWLNRTDLDHIHRGLERKHIPIRQIRSMCTQYRNHSSTSATVAVVYLFIISVVLSVL